MGRGAAYWIPIVLSLALMAGLGFALRPYAMSGKNDFVALYAGAKLAGTARLYDRQANLNEVKRAIGMTIDSVVYTRPPFYAALLKPFALLPYRTAYAVFTAATLACFGWFVVRFASECRNLPFFAAMSVPMLIAVCGGQDTPFLLALTGCSILLARRGRNFAAGLVLSLCAIKFHLFVFIPLMLLMLRRWRVLAGGVTGGAVLFAIGLAAGGIHAWTDYIGVLRDPWINPLAIHMPNLHGFVASVSAPAWVEPGVIALVVAAFFWIARHRDVGYERPFAVSLICGLLTSFHSGLHDHVLLLAAFVLLERASVPAVSRAVMAFILTPIPSLMAVADPPYSAVLPFALLMLVLLFCLGPLRVRPAAVAVPQFETVPR